MTDWTDETESDIILLNTRTLDCNIVIVIISYTDIVRPNDLVITSGIDIMSVNILKINLAFSRNIVTLTLSESIRNITLVLNVLSIVLTTSYTILYNTLTNSVDSTTLMMFVIHLNLDLKWVLTMLIDSESDIVLILMFTCNGTLTANTSDWKMFSWNILFSSSLMWMILYNLWNTTLGFANVGCWNILVNTFGMISESYIPWNTFDWKTDWKTFGMNLAESHLFWNTFCWNTLVWNVL